MLYTLLFKKLGGDMKKWVLFACAWCSLLVAKTYEFPSSALKNELNTHNPSGCSSTDHLPALGSLLSEFPVANLLEFGMGEATQYFLDTCGGVTSVELVTPSNDKARYAKYTNELHKYYNWAPLLKVGSEALGTADALAIKGADPALYDGTYLLEFKDLCDELFSERSYDVVVVNPAIHLRGDLINELFGRVPVIVAHDTRYSSFVYGWVKVSTPFDYVRIDYKEGCGTTFWVHKSREDILKKWIPNYVKQESKKLRIFFPHMHHGVLHSFLMHCQQYGHKMVLPGPTFSTSHPQAGPKLHYAVFKGGIDDLEKDLLDFVEIADNKAILNNPPDVLFVNCEAVEEGVLRLAEKIKKRSKTNNLKIAYYSGNDRVNYSAASLQNLITADATTAYQFDLNNIHYACWIPWIDWRGLEYTGPYEGGQLQSYLALHYTQEAFLPAKQIHEVYTSCYEKQYGGAPFAVPRHGSQVEMYQAMANSPGTLHIKNLEGFGYTIVESLARGRPVFLKRSYSLGKRMMNWCIPNHTALFFDDYEEFQAIMYRFLNDREFRENLQNETAKQIRRFVNNDRQALILENFLQNLK